MDRLGRLFIREVNLTIGGMMLATIIASGLHYASVIHEMQRAREELCAVKIELVVIRNPYLRTMAEATDKCAMLVALTGDPSPSRVEVARSRHEAQMR
jgi:hypothetical protein